MKTNISFLSSLLIGTAFLLSSCAPKTIDEVPELDPLPIDGNWYASTMPTTRFRIDRGRLIVLGEAIQLLKAGRVMLVDLREKSPGVYQGKDISAIIPIPVEIKVLGVNKLSAGNNSYSLIKESADDEIAYNNLLYRLGYVDKESSIKINSNVEKQKVSTEIVTIPEGSTMRIKRERTLENRISYNLAESEGEISDKNLLGLTDGTVIKFLESRYENHIRQTETIEHEITLDGNTAQKYSIAWYEQLRTGELNTYIDGNWRNIPFKFKEWAEIEIKAIK